jgi:tetratricopeptide (TPR) repeat protein
LLDAAHGGDSREDRAPANGTLYALIGILLIAALVGLVAIAWGSPSAQGYYDMRHAETLLGEGHYLEAQSVLEHALLAYDSPQMRLDLSYAYLARRDAVRSERQARIALAAAPPYLRPPAWAQLGRVLLFAGHITEALDAWREAQNAGARYPDTDSAAAASRSAMWHIAMVRWAQGDWASARANLETLSSGTDRYGLSARVKLAQLLAPTQPDTPLPSLASKEAKTSTLGVPAIPDLHVPGLGEGLTVSESEPIISDLQTAQDEAEKALPNGAGQVELDTLWGGSYLQQGENGLAREYLERALAARPDYEPAHARLSLALLNIGDEDGALQHMQTAVRLDGNDPLPHHLLARYYVQRSDWDNAMEQLTILRRLEPNGVEVYLQWGEYYRLLGEYDKAEAEYIDAANLQISGVAAPSGTNAPLTLSRFYTDVRGFGCDKGLPAARQSLALRPDDPASLDAVSWALVLCGQGKEALSGLEQAVRDAPDVPRYRLHLAKLYALLGRYADAREQYNWVLDLDPGGPLERLALDDLVALPPQQ